MRSSGLLALGVASTWGCSNLLIPGGSSVDGSTIISYSADAGDLLGAISHWPAGTHHAGEMREIYNWDSGARLGAIPEAAETYNVIGNTNEHQVTIGETTFGGLADLCANPICDKTYGCIDYGQLIWVTLQRSKTAREAIKVIDGLMQAYGYASEGESFSIADPNEVWMMELIGKGPYAKGGVWVAVQIPGGYVSAHANQARIRSFPRDDPDAVLFAADVVDFARQRKLYNGSDAGFSFSDVYDPVTFSGARFCEARVYTFFKAVAAKEVNIDQYLDYAQGYNLTNRMPLYVKAGLKISVNDTMWHMRNHYEGTWFDTAVDVGAQAWGGRNRLGEDLIWGLQGAKEQYVNERPIGTQYAGWNMIGNQRPKERFSVLWFGVDDSSFSLHTPFYGPSHAVPAAWSDGNCTNRAACREAAGLPGSMLHFSMDAMHWVQNLISNYVYSRYDQIAPVAQQRLATVEARVMAEVAAQDHVLRGMALPQAKEAAAAFSHRTAQALHQEWKDFFGELFVTFVDGYRAEADPSNLGQGVRKVAPHYSEHWKARLIQDAGKHYHVPAGATLLGAQHGVLDKLGLRALGGSRA